MLASIISPYHGAVAQLGERLPCTEEVRGSNPLSSTTPKKGLCKGHCMSRVGKALYDEFKLLVDSGTQESPLQLFLEKHPRILIRTFNEGAHYPTVFPKFHLADQFVPDFVMIGHRSVWSWDVNLIEIEPALCGRPLFNRGRQSTGRLRIAEAQIADWQAWMEKYRDGCFVPRALEELKKVKAWDKTPGFYSLSDGNHQTLTAWYRIIVGRRHDFQGWGTKYQNLKWTESGHRVEIVTWDRLLEKVQQYSGMLQQFLY